MLTVLTMLRRIAQKAKSKHSSSMPGGLDYSLEKSKSADYMVSIGPCDSASKRKEAYERMAAAITATQLKMPGGSEEMRRVIGGGANIPFDSSCDVFIGTPSHRAMMREVIAGLSEKKEYVCHPIMDTLSESGGSDIELSK